MNLDQAQKLLSELEPHLKQINQEISDAQKRKALAENTASSLEQRNKLVIADIESKAQKLKDKLQTDHDQLAAELRSEIETLKTVKSNLQKNITKTNKELETSAVDLQTLESKKEVIDSDIGVCKTTLETISAQLAEAEENIVAYEAKSANLLAQIEERSDALIHVQQDVEIMDIEATKLEDNIIELDAQFKARKQYLDKQLGELQLKLKNVSDSLQEAQNKDKLMREGWAEERLKLDKREEVVKRVEGRLSDSEARIEELDRYGKL